jgi:hypothetical protein
MLTGECYPESEAEQNQNINLELTKHGGHVGYLQKGKVHTYAEERALSFFDEVLNQR